MKHLNVILLSFILFLQIESYYGAYNFNINGNNYAHITVVDGSNKLYTNYEYDTDDYGDPLPIQHKTICSSFNDPICHVLSSKSDDMTIRRLSDRLIKIDPMQPIYPKAYMDDTNTQTESELQQTNSEISENTKNGKNENNNNSKNTRNVSGNTLSKQQIEKIKSEHTMKVLFSKKVNQFNIQSYSDSITNDNNINSISNTNDGSVEITDTNGNPMQVEYKIIHLDSDETNIENIAEQLGVNSDEIEFELHIDDEELKEALKNNDGNTEDIIQNIVNRLLQNKLKNNEGTNDEVSELFSQLLVPEDDESGSTNANLRNAQHILNQINEKRERKERIKKRQETKEPNTQSESDDLIESDENEIESDYDDSNDSNEEMVDNERMDDSETIET